MDKTLREHVERAVAELPHREGVVLTTFNLNASFLEERALPILLGVEAEAPAARSAALHQALSVTPCAVFYDPTVSPGLTGRYRYTARPVPLRGRLFHPKLIIIAGRAADQTTWVYVAVSSANLSLAGWARNAESFGEVWIYTQRQQAWGVLDALLEWLQRYAPLGEHADGADAVARVRAALARMPADRRVRETGTEFWSGALHARLYTSITHPAGLAAFARQGHKRSPAELWVYSPYWSDLAAQLDAFGAHNTRLIPARREDGAALGLTKQQADALPRGVELRCNPEDADARFWHMKLYKLVQGATTSLIVGSCNFTRAGLCGQGGNVEAALITEAAPDWLPCGGPVDRDMLADEPRPEEGAPLPSPVAVVVAFDWRASSWRWWIDAGPDQQTFVLHLPQHPPLSTSAGTHASPGEAPPRGAAYTLTYRQGGEARVWEGQIVELHLDHSDRVYGRALTAAEILESWRCASAWSASDALHARLGAEEGAEQPRDEAAPTFGAVNLYDLYRAMRALREQLRGLATRPEIQRALLVGRPDSVMALANLAAQDGSTPVIRYLVLEEIRGVLREHTVELDASLIERAECFAAQARALVLAQLSGELGADDPRAAELLAWFGDKLAAVDARTP
jgi:hypothetical protein